MRSDPTTRRRFLQTVAGSSALSAYGISRSLAAGTDETRPVNQDIANAASNAELADLFHGTTAKAARSWHDQFAARLATLLGDFEPPKGFRTEVEQTVKFKDHTRFSLLLHSVGLPSLPLYLLIPTAVDKGHPAPAVLCVHGHGEHGHHPIVGRTDIAGVPESIAKANYDYGLQFVRRGYVVAAPCMIPFGRRLDRQRYGKTDPCAISFVRMQALGQLPISANVRDLRWAISLLQSRPEVQGGWIGCAGLSYGGRMTMMVSALDSRIKVASISGALNLLQERIRARYSCGSQIVPGLLKYGDYSEIGSLIAPRPCVWETGSDDGLIVPKWDDVFRNRLKRIYQAYGVPSNLKFDRFEGGHRWNGDVAYPLFDKVLKAV